MEGLADDGSTTLGDGATGSGWGADDFRRCLGDTRTSPEPPALPPRGLMGIVFSSSTFSFSSRLCFLPVSDCHADDNIAERGEREASEVEVKAE